MATRFALPPALHRGLRHLAEIYDCDAAELVRVAVEEMIGALTPKARRKPKAESPKPKAVKAVKAARPVAARRFAIKPCGSCKKPFAPSGPRSKTCKRCKAAPAKVVAAPRESEYETVWDGSMARNSGAAH